MKDALCHAARPGASEDVEIAGVRIAPERLLHLQRQPVHAAPHVGPADRQPHAHPARNRDHRRASASRTRRSALPSTPAPTRTRYPPGTSISIASVTLGGDASTRLGAAV